MPQFSAALRFRVLVAISVVVAGVAFVAWSKRPANFMLAITREVREIPVTGARVSVASEAPACAREPSPDSLQVCEGRDRVPLRRLRFIARRARRASEATADGDALHASGLAAIFSTDRDTAALDAAIADLRVAAVLNELPAPALVDLSAAYLTRAQRDHKAQDLFRALEVAEQALEIDPGNLAARFNLAMALDRAGLRRQAIVEWSRYRASDPTSAYGRLASRRVRALSIPFRLPLVPPARSASPAEYAVYATLSSSHARDLAWDSLLSEWGIALLIHDTATARLRLAQTEAIGIVLASHRSDPSLQDQVQAIRQRAGDSRSIQRAAVAHMAFASGRAATRAEGQIRIAHAAFSRAVDLADFQPLRAWAEIQHANSSYATLMPEYMALFQELAIRADSVRYPVISGIVWEQLGFRLLWERRYEEAKEPFRRAISLLQRAGEDEKAFVALSLLGRVELDSKNRDAGYEAFHRAMVGLSPYPESSVSAVYGLAEATTGDHLNRAALRVWDEAVSMSEELPSADRRSEARRERAKHRLAVGRMDIDEDLRVSVANTSRFDYGDLLWLTADYRRLRAERMIASDPLRAAATFDSLFTFFSGNPVERVQLLLLAAEARLATGRTEAADRDLRWMLATLDSTAAHTKYLFLRDWLLQNAPLVFDRAVMSSVRAGRPDRALDYMDQRRAALSSVSRAVGWSSQPPVTRPGEIAVELALVGDTLLAWTLAGGRLTLDRRIVGRAALVRTVERARFALESQSDRAARPALDTLYDHLIRPIRPRLGPPGTPLVIVTDGVLAAIPMGALRDRTRGRYLMEDHPLRMVSSLRDPVHGQVPPNVGGVVTLIADPVLDRKAHPTLAPLRGAVGEIDALSRMYPQATRLSGSHARAEAIEMAFIRGGIVHFAGHAIINNERPERSTLAVASAGSLGRDTLTAREIERMDLRRLRLVVLSACETTWAPAEQSGGFAGLAGAFLAAGAGGVVGSLWRVEDENTRVLMEAFHRAYRVSGNGSQALRQAQLELLHSGDRTLASPSAWAGFQYVGS